MALILSTSKWSLLRSPACLVFAIAMALAAFSPRAAAARTWHVPGDALTISAAHAARHDIPPPDCRVHNAGRLKLAVTNYGVIGDPWAPDSVSEWQGTQLLGTASIWIGAIASDNFPYVSTGGPDYEFRASRDLVDRIRSSFEGCPMGNRVGFSASPDDDGDGRTNEDFQNGKDDDGDGLIDEDFEAISDQMFSCEYWDYTEEAQHDYPEHRPLNLHVQQTTIAYGDPGTDGFVGLHLHVTNDGAELLRQVYLAIHCDGDIGPIGHLGLGTDDRVDFYSVDTTLADPSLPVCGQVRCKIQMMRMWDVPDDSGHAGGDAPGALGLLLLDHPTDPSGVVAARYVEACSAVSFTKGHSYPAGEPTNDFERFDAMTSGRQIRRPTGPPDDYVALLSVGPFRELPAGQSLDFDFAFVGGDGPGGVVTNAARALLVHRGRWFNLDGNDSTGVDGRESCIARNGVNLIWQDPCDSLNSTTIEVDSTMTCDTPALWVNNDCDPCTPTPYTDFCAGGCESLIHWYRYAGVVAIGATDLTAVPTDAGVRISWDFSMDAQVDGFLIARAEVPAGGLVGDGTYTALNALRPVPGQGPWEYFDINVAPGETYFYKIVALLPGGGTQEYGPVSVNLAPIYRPAIRLPSPNPASGAQWFTFDLPRPGPVAIEVCDLLGRRVRRLLNSNQRAGRNQVVWDGHDGFGHAVPSGLYVVRMVACGRVSTTRVMRLR